MALDIISETGVSILGDSDAVSLGNTIFFSCGVTAEDGPGVWYRLLGTGRSLTASTCLTSDDVSTRITVFDGDCSTLGCVEVSDAGCGTQHHSVAWMAETGREYYLFVQAKGIFNNGGQFVLYAELTTPNTLCENAIGPLGADGSPTFGSTRSAASGPFRSARRQLQGDPLPTRRGVWYSFLGTGGSIAASTCSESTTFQSSLTVYQGSSCENLLDVDTISNDENCSEEFGSSELWSSIEDEIYYLLVEGADVDAFGNFALSIATLTL
jgi:hypothetical protein